jgi:hypothetical protein
MCSKIRCDRTKSKNLEFWKHLNNAPNKTGRFTVPGRCFRLLACHVRFAAQQFVRVELGAIPSSNGKLQPGGFHDQRVDQAFAHAQDLAKKKGTQSTNI